MLKPPSSAGLVVDRAPDIKDGEERVLIRSSRKVFFFGPHKKCRLAAERASDINDSFDSVLTKGVVFRQDWLSKGHRTSPKTGARLDSDQLLPNLSLRALIRGGL